MSFVPYVPNLDEWKEHFKNFTPSKPRAFYTLKKKHKGHGALPIKLVTPTEQLVQQARSSLKSTPKYRRTVPNRVNAGKKAGKRKTTTQRANYKKSTTPGVKKTTKKSGAGRKTMKNKNGRKIR